MNTSEERLEQVRQLREEIREMASTFAKRHCLDHVACIQRRARQARILGRLEAELARLTADTKPQKAGSRGPA